VVVGALSDSVQEVLELEPEQIEPAPRIGTRLNTDFIKGMGKHNEQFIMILDINRIMDFDELSALHDSVGVEVCAEANQRPV
jgi:purine-binding chemotaxis protein CheW